MNELKLPQAWQDWHVTEEIGEGAYGRVYRAEKENGGVSAVSAIKVIQVPSEKSELFSLRRESRSEEELRRNLKEIVDGYVNEIRAMYRLQGHSHIVSIQDHLVEEADDGLTWRIYIRMEYLQSFNDYALTHSFSRDEIIRLGISLCEALGACAGRGILHRDVKPENLFVTKDGEYKLGDFGIAKAMDKTFASYSSKGTFSYMAPEVFSGKAYDSRADLYSAGIFLYKLANRNRDPFIDPDKQIITSKDREKAMSLRLQGEKFPAPADADGKLAQVILKACEYDPKDRYDSPEAMMQALKQLSEQPKAANGKPNKKRKLLILGAAGILVIAAAILIIILNGKKPPEQKSAEAGTGTQYAQEAEAAALFAQGNAYYMGENGTPDPEKAAELFRQAAELGNADAQNSLGYMYLHGKGVPGDAAKAEELFLQAADQGHKDALFNLGTVYRDGVNAEPDLTKAEEMFRRAADMGDTEALYCLGKLYQNSRWERYNLAEAAELFRQAAEKGYTEAQNQLGLCYNFGDGVEQDYVKAREWFLLAADKGHADAQNNLGRIYRSGWGVKQNDEEAFYWYGRAAENGSPYGYFNLGYFYENGIATAQERAKAAEYYRIAAENGIPGAQEAYENCITMMETTSEGLNRK